MKKFNKVISTPTRLMGDLDILALPDSYAEELRQKTQPLLDKLMAFLEEQESPVELMDKLIQKMESVSLPRQADYRDTEIALLRSPSPLPPLLLEPCSILDFSSLTDSIEAGNCISVDFSSGQIVSVPPDVYIEIERERNATDRSDCDVKHALIKGRLENQVHQHEVECQYFLDQIETMGQQFAASQNRRNQEILTKKEEILLELLNNIRQSTDAVLNAKLAELNEHEKEETTRLNNQKTLSEKEHEERLAQIRSQCAKLSQKLRNDHECLLQKMTSDVDVILERRRAAAQMASMGGRRRNLIQRVCRLFRF